jgi:DNA polymerase-3 subunit epsilon
MLVVDVETTGLDPLTDRMIEFAAAQLRYTDDGRIVEHVKTVGWLEDPGIPIPKEITEVTGITDADVRGRSIPPAAAALFATADTIVSHHAAFDWAFCRRRWPDAVDGKLWACSLQQLDWSRFPVAKQEILAYYHGFFYDAHRASIDVEALIKLLRMRDQNDRPYLESLLVTALRPTYRIRAVGTPFAAKDDLKARRYRWDGERRVWWTTVATEDLPAEQAWLDELYRRYRCPGSPDIKQIDPHQRWA